ncbi:MAG: hypothetical protein RR100_13795, partial [Comamonas sp.]
MTPAPKRVTELKPLRHSIAMAAITVISVLTVTTAPAAFAQQASPQKPGHMLAMEPLAQAFSLAGAANAHAIWYSSTDGMAADPAKAGQLVTSGAV